MENDFRVVVRRPVEEVLPYLFDHDKLPLWLDGLLSSRQTSPGPRGRNTTYEQLWMADGRELTLEGTLTEYDPPGSFAFRAKVGSMTVEGRWTLRAIDGGTEIEYRERADMPGTAFRLMGPLVKTAMRRRHEKAFQVLRRLVEGAR